MQHITAAIQQIKKEGTAMQRNAIVDAHRFKFSCYDSGLKALVPAAREFATAVLNNEHPRRWISFLGPSGVGKTHLMKQTFRLIASKWRIITKTHSDGTVSRRGPNAAHIIPAEDLTDYRAPAAYAKYDLIYIEDIGAGADALGGKGKSSGDVLRSRIKELLQLRSNRWTMLDANFYRGDIEAELDGRIASRLKRDGSWCVEIPASVPDFWDLPAAKIEAMKGDTL